MDRSTGRDKPGGSRNQALRSAHADDPKDASVVAGRVLGPDGKPMKGAGVCLWPKAGNEPVARATTDADGRFRLSAPKGAVAREAKIVAPMRCKLTEALERLVQLTGS